VIALAVLGGAVVLWPRGELARPPGAGQADSTRVVSATLTKVARLDCEEADPGVPGSICIKVSARLAGGRQVTFDTLPCRQALSRRPEPVSEINVPQPPLSEGCETVSCMGHLLGYARVSTTDQQPQLQVDALQGAGCYRVFVETASGARSDRPILTQILDQLRPGDTLVVWKLDRLGRSLRHLVDTVTGLAERGIGFRSLQEAIDTTTPGGKLVFHVFAAWPSSNATSSANVQPRDWLPPGPAAATAADPRS